MNDDRQTDRPTDDCLHCIIIIIITFSYLRKGRTCTVPTDRSTDRPTLDILSLYHIISRPFQERARARAREQEREGERKKEREREREEQHCSACHHHACPNGRYTILLCAHTFLTHNTVKRAFMSKRQCRRNQTTYTRPPPSPMPPFHCPAMTANHRSFSQAITHSFIPPMCAHMISTNTNTVFLCITSASHHI